MEDSVLPPHPAPGKRIVVAALGLPDHVLPLISLAHALNSRGHAVEVATARAYEARVKALGLAFHRISPNVSPTDAREVSIFRSRGGRARAARDVFAPNLISSYNDLCRAADGADLLLAGEFAYVAPAAAEKLGVVWASAVLTPASFHSPSDPPIYSTPLGVRAAKWLSQTAGNALIRWRRPRSNDLAKQVSLLRERRGLAPSGDPLFEGGQSPDLVLALFPEAIGHPQRDWPPQAVQTGYPFDDPSGHPDDIPALIKDFLDAGPPPVVFTLGACRPGEAESFVTAGAEAALQLDRRALFLRADYTTGNTHVAGQLVFTCANPWRVFRRAAAVVHHGGAVDIAHGLRAGRPTLVVPAADEERDNGTRLARLGVALTLAERHFCADALADAISRLEGDSRFSLAAENVRRRSEAEGGAAAACDAVEELLFHGPSGAAPTVPYVTGRRANPPHEARVLEGGLAILRQMRDDPHMPLPRPPYRRLFWVNTIFFMVLFAAMWWYYVAPLLARMGAPPGGPSPQPTAAARQDAWGELITSVVSFILALAIAAPLLGYFTKKSFEWLSDERIDSADYRRRLIFDLRYAAKLRDWAGGVERLKVLAAHVKRETDKTADRINAIAHVTSSVAIFMAGVLLVAQRGDVSSGALIASMAVLSAVFARVHATLRLGVLRHWQAVIEQAQNLPER